MSSSNGGSIAKPGFFAALVVFLDAEETKKPLKLGIKGASLVHRRTYVPKDKTKRSSVHVMYWIRDNNYTWKELSDELKEKHSNVIATFRWKLCDNDIYQSKRAEKRKAERAEETEEKKCKVDDCK